MKRVMTLVGGIIGVVFDAIYSVIMLIGIAAILDLLAGAEGSALFAVIGILETVLGIVTLILNAVTIGAYNCAHEKYAKKRGLIITAVVFNFLLALLLIISLASAVTLITILVMLASIATGVLLIVDLCLENKRVAKANANQEQQQQPQQQPEQQA